MSGTLLPDPFPDSGVYDVGSTDLTGSGLLSDWQELMLEVWYENNRRQATETEVVLFRRLLHASKDRIKARLAQLFEDDNDNQISRDIQETMDKGPDAFQQRGKYAEESALPYPILEQQASSTDARRFTHNTFHSSFIDPTDSFDFNSAPYIHNRKLTHGADMSPFALPVSEGYIRNQSFEATPTPIKVSKAAASSSLCQNTSDGYIPSYSRLRVANELSHNVEMYHASAPAMTDARETPTDRRVRMTPSLSIVIKNFRAARLARGCGSIRGCEKQEGKLECTLQCKRRFKTACDLFRHEETVLPQEFYFCPRCGDPDNATERHLFTRSDKMRSHNKSKHEYVGSIADCKVPNVPRAFPVTCMLCPQERHRSWRARWRHVLWHYEKGHTIPKDLPKPHPGRAADGHEILEDSDNNDDDDDDDDDDDGDDDENGSGKDRQDDNEGGADGGPGNSSADEQPTPPDKDEMDKHANGPQSEFDNFSGFFDCDSYTALGFKTQISLNLLESGSVPSQEYTIHWKERVNQKGGTASVFKVKLATPAYGSTIPKRCPLVVKQYTSEHYHLFEKELRAFSLLGSHPNILRCFGSFILKDGKSTSTYNLLLEGAQCDLFEYFADSPRPRSVPEIHSFWSQISKIGEAFEHIHENKEYFGYHGDVKPDNILYCDSDERFKLADFGFSEFVPRRTKILPKMKISGGTAMYVAAFVTGGFPYIQDFGVRLKKVHKQGKNTANGTFHDGKQTLEEVTLWHQYLRERGQSHHDLTAKILDLVDSRLLQAEPALRFNARQVCDYIGWILEHSGDPCGNAGWTNNEELLTSPLCENVPIRDPNKHQSGHSIRDDDIGVGTLLLKYLTQVVGNRSSVIEPAGL
ncbi:hypothetical protein N0V90_008593 [Kalmusia sp. IMI 367209]|nr:hypothetical protein N0V90_008593 [Kalmusia sp. IMI 367209]